MINYKYILSLLVLVFLSTGCEDYLDINTDPNAATEAPPGAVFVLATTQYSTNRVIDLGPPVSTAGQFWSGGGNLGAGVFTVPERYQFSIFTTGNTWRAMYRDILKNLDLAILSTEEAGDENGQAQCKIFQALTFYTLTVLWGDVPFSEAVDVDYSIPEIGTLNPSFDPQEQVLNGIISLLDEAIALIDANSPVVQTITSEDLIYGGNMDNWRRFAKSLKFRTLMTLVDASTSSQEIQGQISALIAEGDMIQDGGDAAFPFYTDPGNRNPFWGTLNTFAGGANLFYFAGEVMVNIMQDRNDPRLQTYFQPYPFGGSAAEVTGAPAGAATFATTPWVLSTSGSTGPELVRPDAPDILFSFSEQAFLEAEAIIRGFAEGGSAAEADSRLRAGIQSAMTRYGVAPEDIDTYLMTLPDLTTISTGEAREIIAEQIFIDCVVRPVEGWTHWRRTEIPVLEIPERIIGVDEFFRRLPYPPDEIAANSNAPATLPQVDENQWFDQ